MATETKRPTSAGSTFPPFSPTKVLSPMGDSFDGDLHLPFLFEQQGFAHHKAVFPEEETRKMNGVLNTISASQLATAVDSYISVHYHPSLLQTLFGGNSLRKIFKQLLPKNVMTGVIDGADVIRPSHKPRFLNYAQLCDSHLRIAAHVALGPVRMRVLSSFPHFAALYEWYGMEKGRPCDFSNKHLEQFNHFIDAYRQHDDSSMDLCSPRADESDTLDAARANACLKLQLPITPQRLCWETIDLNAGDVFVRSLLLPTICEPIGAEARMIRVTYSPFRSPLATQRASAHKSLLPPLDDALISKGFELTHEAQYVMKLDRDDTKRYIQAIGVSPTVWQQLGYRLDGVPVEPEDDKKVSPMALDESNRRRTA